ncbi:MAG TPA: hypothetical protein VGU63_01475 [Candidatus Acidoferrales bacterium]|nr:hypothetical protein [Candidatus Acidoferrales bacterium]
MNGFVQPDANQYRLLVAVRYLNASEAICKGLQRQRGVNDFHFLVTLRSFIEYTKRGIWFLVWATDDTLKEAERKTFKRVKSPSLVNMDAMINDALGKGNLSHLMDKVPGIDEPFLDCLHALTHGNPISVRIIGSGLDKLFDTEGLLARVELELGVFRILLYRRMLGEDVCAVWKILRPIHDRPREMQATVLIAADLLKKSGRAPSLGYESS